MDPSEGRHHYNPCDEVIVKNVTIPDASFPISLDDAISPVGSETKPVTQKEKNREKKHRFLSLIKVCLP